MDRYLRKQRRTDHSKSDTYLHDIDHIKLSRQNQQRPRREHIPPLKPNAPSRNRSAQFSDSPRYHPDSIPSSDLTVQKQSSTKPYQHLSQAHAASSLPRVSHSNLPSPTHSDIQINGTKHRSDSRIHCDPCLHDLRVRVIKAKIFSKPTFSPT